MQSLFLEQKCGAAACGHRLELQVTCRFISLTWNSRVAAFQGHLHPTCYALLVYA